MVTELTILERLLLLGILPPEGDFTTIKIVRKLRESLSFTEDELQAHQIEQHEDGRTTWIEGAPKPVELGAKAVETVVKALEKLDKDGKVEERHVTLFEKFGLDGE